MSEQKEPMAAKQLVPKESIAIESESVNIQSLIGRAIDKNIPVETMERLLAMAKDMQAIAAKKAYNEAMADFQAECPEIEKTKPVKTKTGELAYKYAPIESIVAQVKTLLEKNGFSYSSNMDLIENGTTKVKVSIKVTHIMGHSEITEMTVPLGNQTQIMSQSQVVAAAQTFAKRYAFCNAFGILTGDEDNDGQTNKLATESPTTPNSAPSKATSPKGDIKATAKQLAFVKTLIKQKGQTGKVTEEQINNLTIGDAKKWIDRLLKMEDQDDTIQIDEPLPLPYVSGKEND